MEMLAMRCIMFFTVAFLGCGISNATTSHNHATATTTPQLCAGTFAEQVSEQVDALPKNYTIRITLPCANTSDMPISSQIQPYTANNGIFTFKQYNFDFTSDITDPASVTLDNCSGTGSITHDYVKAITLAPLVALGNISYTSDPTQTLSNSDTLAESIFLRYESLGFIKPENASYNFTLGTEAHTQITRFITWKIHFIVGIVEFSPGQNEAVQMSNIYSIPTSIEYAGSNDPTGYQDLVMHC